MFKLDWVAAAEWGSAMCAQMIAEGYAPVILIGGRMENEDEVKLSCIGAPGVDEKILGEVLDDFARAKRAGAVYVIWSGEGDGSDASPAR